MKKVNCMQCKHYFVTWDPRFPKGCRAFQFKTANVPSVDVFRSSGDICLKFADKRANGKG